MKFNLHRLHQKQCAKISLKYSPILTQLKENSLILENDIYTLMNQAKTRIILTAPGHLCLSEFAHSGIFPGIST